MTSINKYIQEHFTCPICYEILKNPITTICGHNFCKSCIIANNLECAYCKTTLKACEITINYQIKNFIEETLEKGSKNQKCNSKSNEIYNEIKEPNFYNLECKNFNLWMDSQENSLTPLNKNEFKDNKITRINKYNLDNSNTNYESYINNSDNIKAKRNHNINSVYPVSEFSVFNRIGLKRTYSQIENIPIKINTYENNAYINYSNNYNNKFILNNDFCSRYSKCSGSFNKFINIEKSNINIQNYSFLINKFIDCSLKDLTRSNKVYSNSSDHGRNMNSIDSKDFINYNNNLKIKKFTENNHFSSFANFDFNPINYSHINISYHNDKENNDKCYINNDEFNDKNLNDNSKLEEFQTKKLKFN